MKLLLTGENGKFVTLFENYVKKKIPDYEVEKISLRGDEWEKQSLKGYDVIVHCAGIVNSDKDCYDEYQKINVEKTRRLCEIVTKSEIQSFVYLSSMAVYDGMDWGFERDGIITDNTNPIQKTYYGRSKYEAELAIDEVLSSSSINVMIVRAPSIVGKGMENYFSRYIKMADIGVVPIPNIHRDAKRSFVYVDTLIEFILLLLRKNKSGVFYPQNLPLLSVSEIYEEVCRAKGYKRMHSKFLYNLLPQSINKRFFQQICYDEKLNFEENREVGEVSSYDAIHSIIHE